MSDIRPFLLDVTTDHTGDVGPGVVAVGIQLADGMTMLKTFGPYRSVTIYNDMDALKYHCHGGDSHVRWVEWGTPGLDRELSEAALLAAMFAGLKSGPLALEGPPFWL